MTKTYNCYASHGKDTPLVPWTYAPHNIRPYDVEIKITHCGICGSDIHTIDSGWGPTKYPVVVGHEIVGNVVAVGSSVQEFKVGDRVGVGAQVGACLKDDCTACSRKRDQYCPKMAYTYNSKYEDGTPTYGGYAEFVTVDSHYAFKIPDAIPSDVAAPLLCAGVTTYAPLVYHGVKAGMTVGVVGIGGLGHLGLQWARAMGCNVVAFSHSPSKQAEAAKLGAHTFVNMQNKEDIAKAKRSVDFLLVTANAPNTPFDLYLSFVKTDGKLVLVGAAETNVTLSPFSLIGANLSISGSLIGSRHQVKEMLEFAAEHKVFPKIEKLPMKSCNEGIQRVRSGQVRYRVVLEN